MIVGIPKETFPGERRVAIVPATVPALVDAGFEVILEAGAGVEAGFPDDQFAEQGAKVVGQRSEVFSSADVILQVRAAGANPEAGRADFDRLREGQTLIGMCEPLSEPQTMAELAGRKLTCFALELLPRITRAQSMDVLSSMANIAGYKAALLAANELPRMFPMMMTAAGTITPAKVLVVGAGVAGLQAIATARRLGSVVNAYDIRPAVKEEVQSLGAKFVELEELQAQEGEASGGYAKAMDEEFYRRQRELMAKVVAGSDVVITTAAVPGKKAPVLVTGEMVQGMAPRSVIVDLAAERGGNCELTRPGETVVEHEVTILGPVNLPATIPYHASQMYARNISTFLLNLAKDGQLQLDSDDEIIQGTLVTRNGKVAHQMVREALGLSAAEQPSAEAETAESPPAEEGSQDDGPGGVGPTESEDRPETGDQ